jgi:hypothetical protein
MIQEERERERERVRECWREDKTVNERGMLGTSLRLHYVVIANSMKLFNFLSVERVRGRNGIKYVLSQLGTVMIKGEGEGLNFEFEQLTATPLLGLRGLF